MVGLVQFSFKVVDARIDARCRNSKLVFAEFPASSFKFRYGYIRFSERSP